MIRDANEIRKRCEATVRPMVQEFDNIKGKLFEIAENIYPMAKRTITDEVDQTWKHGEQHDDDKVINTVPFEALRKGAAGFLINLMNPAMKWCHLEPSKWVFGERDDGQSSTSEYLEKLENFMFDVMAKGGSYRAFKKIFEHLLAFGFGCILVREDKRFIAKAECLPIGTYALGVGPNGKVNRVNRRFSMTAEELVAEFGCGEKGLENLPEDVVENWKRGNNGKDGNYIVECLIEPNVPMWACGTMEQIDYGVPKSAKYRAIYWLRGRGAAGTSGMDQTQKYGGILAIRSYKYNPIIAPRLDCELNGIYGRGRGHDALNACRALQALMFDELEISSNRAEPPLLASNDLREEGLDLSRGAVTYTNMGEQRSDLVTPILTNPPTSDETRQTAQEFEQRICATFFLGEFNTIDSLKNINSGDKRTAAEIQALKSENMLQLGGIVLMLEDELLDPVVSTFIQYCIDSKVVKTLGAKNMKANELMPRYVGNLQIAQRTQELNSTENSLNFAMGIAGNCAKLQVAGGMDVLDNFDFDRIVRSRHDMVGASALHLKNVRDVQAIRDQREEARKQAQTLEAQKQESEIALAKMKAAAQGARAEESAVTAGMLGGNMGATLGGY